MSVAITWSLTNGGAGITDVTDASVAAGATTTETTVFLQHDGTNPITNAKLFLDEYISGGDPAADLAEILAWGLEAASDDYGGLQMNMNANGGFPAPDWPVYDDKQRNESTTFGTGVGSSISSGIPLSVEMGPGVTSTGTVVAGVSPDASFRTRVLVPVNEGSTGQREVSLKLSFTYTS